MNLQELVDGYLAESKIDYVGLWQIAQASKEELGADTADQVKNFSLEIVKQLYDNGLRPGNYCGDFDYWPDEGCQAMLDRIEREWIKAGEDPNLGEPICRFAPCRDQA
jgi:hypothetical protein